MPGYLATFYTHLSALRSQRALQSADVTARLAPVPREVSSSCGVCVRYEGAAPHEELMDEDLESIYAVGENGYELLIQKE